ncbi:MAG: permease [Candidatus Eisenbacteria bacterium]|nr:permease [Candidatus Eisenbacteria bacterium]MBU1947088.1 permease [Candidatus Eisenbacteria bacterium]
MLYRIFPGIAFTIFEYLFETIIIVFVSIYVALLFGRYFLRFNRYFPKNPVTAFLYGSLIPVCSCAAIPLVSTMRGKMKFQSRIAFVLAAPVLSPQIIVMSFSILGFRYGILRILASFLMVLATAHLMGFFSGEADSTRPRELSFDCARNCGPAGDDIYLATFRMFKKVLPYLITAGMIGIALESMDLKRMMLFFTDINGPSGILMITLIGIPLYFCNGAEILFLRPLVSHGFPLGSAVAVSLTSTAICISSIGLLFQFMGKRLTLILTLLILGIALVLALLINAIFPA